MYDFIRAPSRTLKETSEVSAVGTCFTKFCFVVLVDIGVNVTEKLSKGLKIQY